MKWKSSLTTFLENNDIKYFFNQSLKLKTWIHRGPIVPFYIIPDTIEKLRDLICFIEQNGLKYIVVGHTSNIYISDSYQIDVCITTSKLDNWSQKSQYIYCEAGVNVSRLSRWAVDNGLVGFEGLIDLPGTVGAALVNNSSCFSCCLSNLLIDAQVLIIDHNHGMRITTFAYNDFKYLHRSSIFKRGELRGYVLSARLRATIHSDPNELIKIMQMNSQIRKNTQEGKLNNLGSIYSSYKERKLTIDRLGSKKILGICLFRIVDKTLRKYKFYQIRRVIFILNLYGYPELRNYISRLNINCFIWRDAEADKMFIKYCEFMNKYAVCGPMEIQVFK